MTSLDLDAVMRKVRALHRLTTERGATEAEATAAATAAQRLIELHRLDLSTLDASESDGERAEAETVSEQVDPLDVGRSAVAWRGVLAAGIARANGCRVFWARRGRETAIRVIGTPSRAAAVRYLFAWLAREIDRLGTEASRGCGRSYGRAFRVGCATRIATRIEDAAAAAAAEARAGARAVAGSPAAIVRLDSRLARLESESNAADSFVRGMKMGAAPRHAPVRGSGYLHGLAAGDTVQLGSGPALERGTTQLGGDR